MKEVRRHWFAFFTQVFALVIAGFFPFLMILLSDIAGIRIFTEHPSAYLFFSSVWLLLVWVIFFSIWTNHHLDVLVITNKRIVDIEQFGLFSHDLAEVRLDHIQDVKVQVFGIIATFLDFGNISIQTAAATEEFKIKMIPNPHKVNELIAQQIMAYRSK